LEDQEFDMKELKHLEEENVLHQKILKSLLRSVESVPTGSDDVMKTQKEEQTNAMLKELDRIRDLQQKIKTEEFNPEL
jgi:hypothetical protein